MLIRCPECNAQVSDKAVACPTCGYPIEPSGIGETTSSEVRGDGDPTSLSGRLEDESERGTEQVAAGPVGEHVKNRSKDLTIKPMLSESGPASRGRRAVGFIIDILTVIILCQLWPSQDKMASKDVAWLTTAFLYYLSFEGIMGNTVGKALLRTKVLGEDGKKLTFWSLAGRTLCRFIPFDGLAIFGHSRRTLHDLLSGTVVVEDGRLSGWRKFVIGSFVCLLFLVWCLLRYPGYMPAR